MIDRNYSGTGVDIAECKECGNVFQVSYRVDKIIRLKKLDWTPEE